MRILRIYQRNCMREVQHGEFPTKIVDLEGLDQLDNRKLQAASIRSNAWVVRNCVLNKMMQTHKPVTRIFAACQVTERRN